MLNSIEFKEALVEKRCYIYDKYNISNGTRSHNLGSWLRNTWQNHLLNDKSREDIVNRFNVMLDCHLVNYNKKKGLDNLWRPPKRGRKQQSKVSIWLR